MNTAVLHETAFENGGGVTVVETICQAFDADLYFGFATDEVVDAIDPSIDVIRLFDNSFFSRFKQNPTFRHLFYLWRFSCRPELHEYDVVVQSGSGTDWYVPSDGQGLVRYVHSPAAHYQDAATHENSPLARVFGLVSRTLREPTLRFPSVYLANSDLTARRVRQYLDVDPEVVHPPVEIADLDPEAAPDGEYYLSLSRLTSGKSVEEIVRTFTNKHSEKRLVVAGDGPRREAIEAVAGDNVDVVGYVSEERKRELFAGAKAAVINSGNETFGITAVESFASGTPVLAVEGGFTPHLVENGRYGYVYERGNLGNAISRFESIGVGATTEDLIEYATNFNRKYFEENIKDAIEAAAVDP
jgi:glycosyltransferase involved in cell wall biosynthesis